MKKCKVDFYKEIGPDHYLPKDSVGITIRCNKLFEYQADMLIEFIKGMEISGFAFSDKDMD